MTYSKILLASIEREKNGTDYVCPEADKVLLQELFDEINSCAGTNFRTLAELDAFRIPGSGNIITKYIAGFTSETVKGYLIPQIVADKVVDCDKRRVYLKTRMSRTCAHLCKI